MAEQKAYFVLSSGVWEGTVVGNTDTGELIVRMDGRAETVPYPLIKAKS